MKGRTQNSRAKTSAERQRDFRKRKKRGEIIWPIPLPEETVRDFLLDEGRVKEWDEDDRQRLTEALINALRDHVEGSRNA